MTTKSLFTVRLKELRLSRGLSQSDLATQIHISPTSINRYERGTREPDFNTLKSVADFFEVDYNYLLGWPNAMARLDEKDLNLVQRFHALDDRGKSTILNLLEYEYSAMSTK